MTGDAAVAFLDPRKREKLEGSYQKQLKQPNRPLAEVRDCISRQDDCGCRLQNNPDVCVAGAISDGSHGTLCCVWRLAMQQLCLLLKRHENAHISI